MQKCRCGKRMKCVATYQVVDIKGKHPATHKEFACECGSVRIVDKRGKEVG